MNWNVEGKLGSVKSKKIKVVEKVIEELTFTHLLFMSSCKKITYAFDPTTFSSSIAIPVKNKFEIHIIQNVGHRTGLQHVWWRLIWCFNWGFTFHMLPRSWSTTRRVLGLPWLLPGNHNISWTETASDRKYVCWESTPGGGKARKCTVLTYCNLHVKKQDSTTDSYGRC